MLLLASLKTMPGHGGHKLARCGYTLRVTSQASYSPEYITPTQKKFIFKHVDDMSEGHFLVVIRRMVGLCMSCSSHSSDWNLSQSTLCRMSWVFSGCSPVLPQGELTGWVRISPLTDHSSVITHESKGGCQRRP